MRVALIGVGQAGGKVVEALVAYDERTGSGFVADALAVNTARADLHGLERIPVDRQLLVGVARVKGHGVGADNELGARVVAEDVGEVMRAVDDVRVHEVDAFVVVAGLGGGTGSGGAPVVARELRRLYTEPVYGLGILPATDEGGIYTLNAARSLRTFVDEVDALLLFDNDAWRRSEETLEAGYASINEELARRLGVLLSAGEVRPDAPVAESVVDASEVVNTLAGGGIATVGYAATPIEGGAGSGGRRGRGGRRGLFRRSATEPAVDEGASVSRATSLVRRATLGRLTLPCEVDGAERALVVLAGPPAQLSRKGIEHGRRWLEEATGTMEVRGGDYPVPDSNHVAAVVLLAGVTNVPRVRELQRVAVEAQRNAADREATSADALGDLLRTEDEALDSLF
jgi:cell division GTPase FtsZ